MKVVGRQTIRQTEFNCDCSGNAKLNLIGVKAEMSHHTETIKYEEFQCPVCHKIYHASYTLDNDLKVVCFPVAFPERNHRLNPRGPMAH